MSDFAHKTSIEQLAIFGGEPMFDQKLFVGRPNIGNRDKLIARLNDMLDRRWLSNQGPYEQEFERMVAKMLNVKHVIAVTNATLGLEIMARAADLHDEVIVPSNTFVATAHALEWQRITPVFADCDPVTHNIDPQDVECKITPRTTGIVATHVWGNACDIAALQAIARQHNLKLMFDSAHAYGCSHNGVMLGNFGDAEAFSFHATKFINAFEGGVITTNNDALAERMRNMRRFGFHGVHDDVQDIGTNAKMTEIQAAMGITSLESFDEFVATNRDNYYRYHHHLSELSGVRFFVHNEREKHNYQYVVIEMDADQCGITRDEVVNVLHAEHVIARRYFYPGVHRMQPYVSRQPQLQLPATERLCARSITLPTGTAVGAIEIDAICQLIEFVLENGAVVSARMRHH